MHSISTLHQTCRASLLLFCITLLLSSVNGVKPTREIELYPNTQDSPSLYLISFETSVSMSTGEYILLNMDWLSANAQPNHCILVNSTVEVRCTNFDSPSFQLSFDKSVIGTHN